MMPTTFDDYLIAIRKQYEFAKLGIYSGYLINPSPAQLRNFCLLLFENKLSKSDEEVFRLFFEPSEEDNLRKSITNFDVEKFKAVGNFLKGKSEKTNGVSLNLIAILVGFEPRPYAKFLKSEGVTTVPLKIEEEIITVSKPIEHFVKVSNKNISVKKIMGLVALVIVFLLSSYVVKDVWSPEKQCMQWQKDHYEPVDCNITGIGSLNKPEPIDSQKMKLRRMPITKKTPFFSDGKALVWYCKCDTIIECFNAPGFHPENGKPLRPITKYMINKYIKD